MQPTKMLQTNYFSAVVIGVAMVAVMGVSTGIGKVVVRENVVTCVVKCVVI